VHERFRRVFQHANARQCIYSTPNLQIAFWRSVFADKSSMITFASTVYCCQFSSFSTSFTALLSRYSYVNACRSLRRYGICAPRLRSRDETNDTPLVAGRDWQPAGDQSKARRSNARTAGGRELYHGRRKLRPSPTPSSISTLSEYHSKFRVDDQSCVK